MSEKFSLSEEQQRFLLREARDTLESVVRGGDVVIYETDDPLLRKKMGVFVTLNKVSGGVRRLRGCIGYPSAIKPLYIATPEMARAAALEDPRFPPVSPEETHEIEIEISVLSPWKVVKEKGEVVDLDELVSRIKVGRDGLILFKGPYSGLLLPQVPVEWGWDEEEFLVELTRKAGIPEALLGNAGEVLTSPETEIYSFEAFVFSESDLSGG